ncbi:processed acidic surface protein [Bacillus sp. FJAT-49732]|uniref:Processed acidic surface protein n=1 Tax=Lederbergia citrisecunda TaxID=2833583 RepID=A0A942TME2_9BACI|nr:processed acidic surface protein [Lederbergia citrisecunda]MBS4198554.1 processed acidic surface protein [Lederbergia citrisecunda]
MKRVLSLVMAFTLLVVVFPIKSFALTSNDIAPVLEDTGFTEDELETFLLLSKDLFIEEIKSVQEVYDALGEPINGTNLQKLLSEYNFSSEKDLEEFLIENGELEKGQKVEEVFKYINYLDFIISFYTDLSTPITTESLNQFLKNYDLTMADLNALLKANDDAIENYESIEELEFAVVTYIAQQTFDQLGITEDEIMNLFIHIASLQIDETKVESQLKSIMSRLDVFSNFDSAKDLSKEQIVDMAEIMKELMGIFQIDAKFYLYKGGHKTKELSYEDLISLETTNGSDLLIELYNYDGVLLADLLLTADLFNSGLIEQIKETEKAIVKPIEKMLPKKPKTVKGAKMPNTAGNYVEGSAVGLILTIGGLFLIRRRFVKQP